MAEYIIGIPSYRRADKQTTLEYLERIGVSKERIVLSVQTEEDLKDYRKHGYEDRVLSLLYRPGTNASDNRNTILCWSPLGAKIVLLDDDIKGIGRLSNGKLHKIETAEEFEKFIRLGFGIAEKERTIGFTAYPVYNAFFMSRGYTRKNIGIGTLFAIINTGLRFSHDFSTKEDYELSCRIIRQYGAFPRLNSFACDAAHYTKGGCEKDWSDKQKIIKTARILVGMYPDLLVLNKNKPGEVKMVKEKKQP